MAKLRLKNISKIFEDGFKAVDNFTLDIDDGEFVVLVGPSGCGKSTTLRMIAGLEDISAGELYIGDRLVNDLLPRDRDIAMVFQSYALYPDKTVYKNIAFALERKGLPKDEIKRKVLDAAETLGIEKLLERKPKALSGGQRQRVALGRAIVREPSVFLFDEPLSNLDAKLRAQMRKEIAMLHKRMGTTFIYVTHDQTEAMTMGDRVVVMKDGIIRQADTPTNLYRNPCDLFVASFIGSPEMNFLEGVTVKDDKGVYIRPAGDVIRINGVSDEGKDIVLGIRPEDILLMNDSDFALKGEVEVVENTGDEITLYLKYDNFPLTVKTSPDSSCKVGDTVSFIFRDNKIHIFDKETGKKLLTNVIN